MLHLAPRAASHGLALAADLCWGLEAEYLIAGLWRTDSIKTFLSLCAQMQLQADIMLHKDHNGSCNAKGQRKDLHPRRGCTQGSREARLITLRQKQGLEWKKEEGEVRGNIKPSVCRLHGFERRSG